MRQWSGLKRWRSWWDKTGVYFESIIFNCERGKDMNEQEAFQILNGKQVAYYQEGSVFVVEYEYYRHWSGGREFLKAFNLIFGDHGKEIRFNDVPYRVVSGKYHIYNGGILDAHLGPNRAKGELKEIVSYNISASQVNINTQEVKIYTDSLSKIKAERFMMEDEKFYLLHRDLISTLNNIENALENLTPPTREDLSLLRAIGKSVPELTGFIANIITILTPFL